MESAGSFQAPSEGVTPRRISLELEEKGFISLGQAPRSPTRHEQHPVLVEFTKHLRARVDEVWRNRHGSRYKHVRVLLVHWEADDLGVSKEIDVLEHVFSDLYFYDVYQYAIPNHRPDWSLKRRVLDFVEDDCRDTLLVFYYAGHAFINPNRHDTPMWAANRRPNSASLPLGGIQSILEEAQCDVLLLYDTCHSADTAVSSAHSSRGTTEVIAACGFESVAAEVGQHSFTNALANILAIASNEQGISVSEVHKRILTRLKRWQSSPITDSNGRFLRTRNGRVAMEIQRRRTPVYCNLTSQRTQRSIFLAPLQQKGHVKRSGRAFGPDSKSREERVPPGHHPVGTTCTTNIPRSNEEAISSSELLVTIKLVDEVASARNFPDRDAWVEWLRNAPAEASEIEIDLKGRRTPTGYRRKSHESPPPFRSIAQAASTRSSQGHNGKRLSFFDPNRDIAPLWRSDIPLLAKFARDQHFLANKTPCNYYAGPKISLLDPRFQRGRLVSFISLSLLTLLLVGPIAILYGFAALTTLDVPPALTLGVGLIFTLMSTELSVMLSETTRVSRREAIVGTILYCAVLWVTTSLTQVDVYKVFIIHVKTHILPDWAGSKPVFIKSSSYT